ncbi:zinc ion binding / nucleic acid binding protein [Trifolium repens]|jgi:hypothetical protein|nr:zinc ion binding / nucleic acid binding protein [Trifolium repens]KAK2378520.1 zinc ion binding / nucleic acid binding protein [Trifolium repens]
MEKPLVFSARTNSNDGNLRNPPDNNISEQRKSTATVSFRDKLLGGHQAAPTSREKVDLIAQKLVRIEHEDGNRLLPKVYLDDNVFKGMCSSWTDAIVVKLLGKTLGYRTMKDRLQKIWKPTGGFEMRDVDNGFYTVKFDLAADKEKVVSDGPWMIFDHYLAVSHWSPDFISPEATVERTLVWIRFPGLNLVYYDESFLLAMAAAVGKPIKVDSNTLNVERGRFARICIEINLNEPVVGKVWLNGYWYKVEYEGLHIICASCGRYGHHSRYCTYSTVPLPIAVEVQPANAGSMEEGAINGVTDLVEKIAVTDPATIIDENLKTNQEKNINKHSRHDGKELKNNDVQSKIHGEWMVVTRKKKKQPVPPKNVVDSKFIEKPNNVSMTQPKRIEKIPGMPNIGLAHFNIGLEDNNNRTTGKKNKRSHEVGPSTEAKGHVFLKPALEDNTLKPSIKILQNQSRNQLTPKARSNLVSNPRIINTTSKARRTPNVEEEDVICDSSQVSSQQTVSMDSESQPVQIERVPETQNVQDANMLN